MPTTTTTTDQPGNQRVPADQRILGLDKRSFPYAGFVIAVFLIATWLIPQINDAVSWDDPVQAGEQLALGPDLAFTPIAGWNVERGFRVGEPGAETPSGGVTLVSDGVTFDVAYDQFDGKAAALLKQISKVTRATQDDTFTVDGKPGTITTRSGNAGVIQAYSSVNGDGVIAAFVIDGTGVKVTAYGPPAQMITATTDIATMLASIHQTGTTGSKS